MIASARFALIATLLLAAAACGLKGPLYLPDTDGPAAAGASENGGEKPDPARRVPAPQSQKKDRSEEPGELEAPADPPGVDRTTTPPLPQDSGAD